VNTALIVLVSDFLFWVWSQEIRVLILVVVLTTQVLNKNPVEFMVLHNVFGLLVKWCCQMRQIKTLNITN